MADPPDAPTNASAADTSLLVSGQSKRQRRPSVRLGDPGEQPAAALPSSDSLSRRLKPHPHHHWHPLPPSSKTRPLTHLPAPDDDENLEPLAASLRRAARPKNLGGSAKRVRSGWPPRTDDPTTDPKPAGGEESFRQGSASPSDRGQADPTDGDAPFQINSEGHGQNSDGTHDNNGALGLPADSGVRSLLNRLGLGRYAPVFEIHEVDDEVLPMLTMEDLKDMGINAVGSRRKMYCAIQKLRKSLV